MIGNFSVRAVGLWRTVIRFESSGVSSHAGALNSPAGGFVSPVGGFVLLVSSLLLTSRKTRRSKRHDVQHKTILAAVQGLCASETPRIAHPNVSARSKFHGMTPVGAVIRKPRHCRKGTCMRQILVSLQESYVFQDAMFQKVTLKHVFTTGAVRRKTISKLPFGMRHL